MATERDFKAQLKLSRRFYPVEKSSGLGSGPTQRSSGLTHLLRAALLLEQLEVAPGGEFRGGLVEEVGCQITQSVTGQVSLLPSFFHENFLKAHELLPLLSFSQQSLLLLKSPSVK